jgi:hypothetical protein
MAQTLEAVFYHGNDQRRMDHTPAGILTIGAIVNSDGRAGVITSPEGIAAAALGSMATTGVFRILKDGTSGPTFALGDDVEWDDSANLAVAAGAGTFPLGRCVVQAGGTNEDGVYCDLNEPSLT